MRCREVVHVSCQHPSQRKELKPHHVFRCLTDESERPCVSPELPQARMTFSAYRGCTSRHYVANNGTSLHTMANPASAPSTITPMRLARRHLMQSLSCLGAETSQKRLRRLKRCARQQALLQIQELMIFP